MLQTFPLTRFVVTRFVVAFGCGPPVSLLSCPRFLKAANLCRFLLATIRLDLCFLGFARGARGALLGRGTLRGRAGRAARAGGRAGRVCYSRWERWRACSAAWLRLPGIPTAGMRHRGTFRDFVWKRFVKEFRERMQNPKDQTVSENSWEHHFLLEMKVPSWIQLTPHFADYNRLSTYPNQKKLLIAIGKG